MQEIEALASDERTARIILATLCEPGDDLTGRLLRLVGARGAVAVATGGPVPSGIDPVAGQLWVRHAAGWTRRGCMRCWTTPPVTTLRC